jgi:EAL and modified HD-GYP domain-containing signal transduction protein
MPEYAAHLFVTPLADQSGALSALMLQLRSPQSASWLPLDNDFPRLAQAITCRYEAPDGLPDALCQALIGADVLPLTPQDADLGRDAQPPASGESRWFAGRWYMAPPANPSPDQVASRTLALKLIQLVSEDADTVEIENVFRQDPSLAYHMLRLVNSPGVTTGREISSFSQAILILGRQRLRRWLNLILFAARKEDPRAPMLLVAATVRGRLLELLSQQLGHDRRAQDRAFMVGLFSLIGVLFGQPLAELLRPLRISDEMLLALLHHEGELGALLAAVEAAERPGESALQTALEALKIPAPDYNRLVLGAHLWMVQIMAELGGSQRG